MFVATPDCFPQQGLQDALDEVSEVSGVLTVGEDYLLPAVRAECERVIPDVDGVKPCDAVDTFLFLKAHYHEPSI